ncbi:PREDICTED: mediator of RNA polymerase II transcription subunit 31-like [Populus euphratica]|uniref:Mediator of RNA polymerase II transcription subunit 31 n=1 Tax=Populus euphratica TaxID=75702 RepID=A0AAJ6X330_POPEU|nr:PREDICTED: mediator of RNA polymerase II transcription subunit 31-like [Populus euphratica]
MGNCHVVYQAVMNFFLRLPNRVIFVFIQRPELPHSLSCNFSKKSQDQQLFQWLPLKKPIIIQTLHPRKPKKIYKDPDDGRQRFLLELEFVQCLANPTYIHYLAQNRYFEDEAFIGYLKYLQYWQRPEYVKFIMYPHCLYFLELLQNANFRNAMAHPGNKELAHRQQFFFWKNYRNNRLKHILPRPLPEHVTAPPAPVQPPVQPAPPVSAATLGMPSAPGAVPSPMPYGMPPGSAFGKSDIRSSGSDRRKRKKEV